MSAKPFLEPVPGRPRCNLDHEVDVLRHPRLRRRLVGDPQCDGRPADERDLVDERRQLLRGPLEHGDAHDSILSLRSFSAS